MTRRVALGRTVQIERLRAGDPLTARYFNRNFGTLARALGIPAPRSVPAETVAPGDSSEPPGTVAIEWFTVNAGGEGVDTLATTRVSDSSPVTVAKPWNLRGNEGSRTVSGELQVITPAYETGHSSTPVEADLLCAEVGVAMTGIAGVAWIDLNIAGRMWAEVT